MRTALVLAARLAGSRDAPRVVHVHVGDDFDTHNGQARRHPAAMGRLDEGVKAFLATLDELHVRDRVVLATMSEFGRRAAENGTGTDHGAAAAHLVLGRPVKGGRHGAAPSLVKLDPAGNLRATVDYRTYDATLLGWLDPGFDRGSGARPSRAGVADLLSPSVLPPDATKPPADPTRLFGPWAGPFEPGRYPRRGDVRAAGAPRRGIRPARGRSSPDLRLGGPPRVAGRGPPPRRAEARRRGVPRVETRVTRRDLGPRDRSPGEDDPEMRKMLQDDLADKEARLAELETEIKELLLPRDPNEGRNVIVEIQGAEGGEEANLWAGDLFRMYQRFAERHGLKIEVLSSQPSDQGGYRDVTFVVKGDDAWGRLKYEGGPHRVQRVPGHREPGSHPHERGDGRGAARSRRGRRRDRSQRSRDRRVPVDRARAASRSTPPTPRCASRTSRPGSSSRARTRRASSRTRTRRCASCARGCCSSSRTGSRPRSARRGATR